MSTRKLLFATALFTSSAAMAGEVEPILEVTRVVTNGKGPACTLVAGAPEGIVPEVREKGVETVLAAEAFSWDGEQLCLVDSGARELTLRFFGELEPAAAAPESEKVRSGRLRRSTR